MRTFLLVLIACMAATPVLCVLGSFPVSVACNSSSTALDNNPDVDVAESYINKTGCTKLEFDTDLIINRCRQDLESGERICTCDTILGNTSAWESAVTTSSGRPCYVDLLITLTGTRFFANTNRTTSIQAAISNTNFAIIAVGNACNDTEIKGAALTPFATEGIGFVNSSLNGDSNLTGVTWTSGSVTVTACGISSPPLTKVIPSSNSGGTTTPPTTPTPSGSSSNSNSTSSPTTTVPPLTPTPTSNSSSSSSSSSSTGGKGTGTSTGNGNGNGASTVMMHSATVVMVSLISAAVTVIGAA